MAASPTFAQNIGTYKKVEQAVKQAGHVFRSHDDVATMNESIGKAGELDIDDWRMLCKREVAMARESDAAIFDATNKATFGIGYLAAVALQAGKPVLLLMREGSLQGSIITGLEDPMLRRGYFNEEDVVEVVKYFLLDATAQEWVKK